MSRFFDVGANRGDYALAAIDALGEAVSIHCFEPSAAAFAELEVRVGGHAAVTLVNKGMSDSPGRRQMFGDRPGSPLGSLYQRHLDHLAIDVRETEEVELTTVDRVRGTVKR